MLKKLLELRGVPASEFGGFLHPTVSDLADPRELAGIPEAAELILASVAAGRKIVVFGDYDCDGVSATAILTLALRKLGAEVVPFIPERLSEGYGMSDASVARMLAADPDVGLVVTVDNGINSVAQVASLKARGVSVIVTDHHLPGAVLPAADALVDPKVSAPEPLAGLCGAGVAFMLANRLVIRAREKGMYRGGPVGGPLLVLAGLATVTDIMPLLGQNRILVAEALRRFHTLAPIGLWELYHRAARNCNDRLCTRDFGFAIGPRINAVGRLDSAMKALGLMLEEDREAARRKAAEIDLFNVERKGVEQKMTEEALAKVVPGAAAQVIHLPDGHEGVAGIVASRVLERLASDPDGRGPVPVCVIAGGHGSARSPDGVNIHEAFAACSETLVRFGGHAAAAGFSVKEGRIDDFRRQLAAYCEDVLARRPVRKGSAAQVELWLDPDDLTLDLAEQLTLLEPFGEGNPAPVFGLRGVALADVRTLGAEGRHLQLSFRNRSVPRAVWWNRGDRVEELRAASSARFDLVFNLEVSDYGGRHAELRLVDLAPAAGAAG